MSVSKKLAMLRALLLGTGLLLAAAGSAFADSHGANLPANPCQTMGCGGGSVGTIPSGLPEIVVTPAGGANGVFQFRVANTGQVATGAFRVAVLDNANSYGFTINNLPPGQSHTYSIPFSDACGAVVIANMYNTVKVSDPNSETITICSLNVIDPPLP